MATPDWSHAPPAQGEHAGIRLVRVPDRGILTGFILSTHLLGCHTHYAGGRTIPCTPPDCPECRHGYLPRWHGYLAFIERNYRWTRILELPPLAAAQAAKAEELYAALRGLLFQAYRPQGRLNSRAQIEFERPNQPPDWLPTEPDITAFMAMIWGLSNGRNPETAPPRRQNIRDIPRQGENPTPPEAR